MKRTKWILSLLTVLLSIMSIMCDNKSDKDKVPTVTTLSITNITATTATGGGNVLDDGGADVIARGVCWSVSPGPTINDSSTIDGAGTGLFTSNIIGLTSNTTYYVKAYCTNNVGTNYGEEVSFISNSSPPTVVTTAITDITTSSVSCGGNVTADGGAAVTVRGVCWNVSQNPTIANSITSDGTGTGVFTSSITGLSPNTTYYVRAYATNSAGTNYGLQIVLTTSFVDGRDGNIYKAVQIGEKIWMAENLNYRTSDSSWYYNNDSTTYHIYGRLYTWNRVLNAAPTGWHVATDAEWAALTTYLGGENVAGGKLKESGASHWELPNTGATDEVGFSALPGGSRDYDGMFFFVGYQGAWWSATEDGQLLAWDRTMGHNRANVERNNWGKTNALSIRCVKD